LLKLIYNYFSPHGLEKSKNISNSSRLVLKEAEKLGITWKIIPGTEIITLNYHGKEESYFHQIPTSTTALGIYACNNKKTTINLLRQAGLCVPRGYRISKEHNEDYLKEVFNFLAKPLVIKPGGGTWGENITVNVTSYKDYLNAIKLAFNYSSRKTAGAIVEEMFFGEEYRILLTRKKIIGVLQRIPANVIGDGILTIKELIKLKNQEDIRGSKGSDKSHLRIIIDIKLREYLKEQNLDLDSVVEKGKRIYLRKVSNVSQGGDAIDFTDQVHPSVKKIALQAINAIPGLSFAGLDFMSKDITKEQTKGNYVIIEVNDSPGFDIHDFPYQGKKRYAAREFLFLIFPELKSNLERDIK